MMRHPRLSEYGFLRAAAIVVAASFVGASCDGEAPRQRRHRRDLDDEATSSVPGNSVKEKGEPPPPPSSSAGGLALGPNCSMYFSALECMASKVDEDLAADIRRSAKETRATIARMHPALPEEGCRAATLEMKNELDRMGCGAFVPPLAPSQSPSAL